MSDFASQLAAYFRARFTLIVIVTDEEQRAVDKIQAACKIDDPPRTVRRWDAARGIHDSKSGSAMDAQTLLETITSVSANDRVVYVLHDFHLWWENPEGNKTPFLRLLRSAAQDLKRKRACIVVTTPRRSIPDELREEAFVVEMPLPDETEIEEILVKVLSAIETKPNQKMIRQYVQAARGLSSSQAERAFGEVLVKTGKIDQDGLALVNQSKKAILRESEALEYFSSDESRETVGGLEVLKEWLSTREWAFTPDAEAYGLPQPKGVALIGIPGTGKSLTAKLISSMWHMPLVRLDVGALFGSLLGESESRLRRAIALAETVAPCVLWIDEIEKAFGGADLDGGTSQRIFGTILNWMQEKTKPVFIIATANDVTRLPPELLRRGRFDEVFFLDLPTRSEREDILRVHVKRRRRNPEYFDIAAIADKTPGFVGAELEQCVVDAMYAAFEDGQRDFTTEDIVRAAEDLVPLCQSQKERVDILRLWLEQGRARSASHRDKQVARDEYVPVEVGGYM